MFYWPHCELTDFEKKYVGLYANGEKPGVLRRTYRAILNAETDPEVEGFDSPHTAARFQISRRSRVFALSFAGDTAAWRLNISNASGTQYTPVNVGAPQVPSVFTDVSGSKAPIVASMCPGAVYSLLSSLQPPPPSIQFGEGELPMLSQFQLPLIIEPNWQLVPNETLIMEGYPIREGQAVLEIAFHAGKFPDMADCSNEGGR